MKINNLFLKYFAHNGKCRTELPYFSSKYILHEIKSKQHFCLFSRYYSVYVYHCFNSFPVISVSHSYQRRVYLHIYNGNRSSVMTLLVNLLSRSVRDGEEKCTPSLQKNQFQEYLVTNCFTE